MATTSRLGEFVRLVRDEQIPFKAAGIAFYALASVVPLLILLLAALSLVGAADTLIETLQARLDDPSDRLVEEILGPRAGRDVASGAGLLVALWSASRIFRGIAVAFAGVYDEEDRRSVVETVLDSFVMIGVLIVAVAVLVLTGFFRFYAPFAVPLPAIVWPVVAFLALVAGLLPLYYVMPPHHVQVGDAIPGAVMTAVGWVVLLVAFASYTRLAGRYAAYGILGAVLLFVTVVYLAAIVLLIGAALNVILEG
jgi:membrane protein